MHPDVEDAVVLRKRAVVLAGEDLERPEAQQHHCDGRHHERGEDGDADVEPIGQTRRDVLGSLKEIHGRVCSAPVP